VSHGFRVGDEKKSQANLAKHGIDFHTASLAFDDPFALTMRDELHGDLESRFIMLAAIAPESSSLWCSRYALETSFA
jgi:uncharacterized DUF497 family protein